MKKEIIFYTDFFVVLASVVGFFLCGDAVKQVYVNLLTVGVMPIMTALNVGISASIYADKKRG